MQPSTSSNISLSIVLPCYNPLPDWEQIVARNVLRIKEVVPSLEVIIVNDGSSREVANDAVMELFNNTGCIKMLQYPTNHGKGYALRYGVQHATGDKIIYTDIDFPYTDAAFDAVLSLLDSHEVVIGIRAEDYYEHLPKVRVYISKFLRFLIRTLVRIPTDDTQCGLKGFRKSVQPVFMQTTINRYLFDMEFIFLATRKNIVIKTCEVSLREGVQLSTMRWNILLHESLNFIKILLKSFLTK